MYCPACGSQQADSQNYCAECGEELAVKTETGTETDTGRAREIDNPFIPDSASESDDDTTRVSQDTSLFGVVVFSIGYAGVLYGSLFRWNAEHATPKGGILTSEPYWGFFPFVISAVMLLLLWDDYLQWGILKTWRPRKARLTLLNSVVVLIPVMAIGLGGSGSGGVFGIVFGSALLLFAFSGLVMIWRFGFEKHVGTR